MPYVVVIKDSRSGTDAELWEEEEEAVARAKELASELDSEGEYEETVIRDWTLYLTYNVDSSIIVMKRDIK